MDNWKDKIAVVVASGPSASTTPLEMARDRARVIVVNESWRLAPWADVLYATDGVWWEQNKGMTGFEGRRVTSSPYAVKAFGIDLFVTVGSCSGMRAIHLAEEMKANPILLVGFEMHVGNGVHWHEPYNNKQLRNPGKQQMIVWRMDMERLATKLADRGTHVINCTPDSAIKCFPYKPFAEALWQ